MEAMSPLRRRMIEKDTTICTGPPNAPKSRFRPLEFSYAGRRASVARFEAAGIRKPSQKPE